MRDFYSNTKAQIGCVSSTVTATIAGTALDTQPLRTATLVVVCGALVGVAIVGVDLRESDDGSTYTTPAAGLVQSDAPAALVANGVYRLGYLGSKRYVRPIFMYTSGTSLVVSAAWIGEPIKRPVP